VAARGLGGSTDMTAHVHNFLLRCAYCARPLSDDRPVRHYAQCWECLREDERQRNERKRKLSWLRRLFQQTG